VCCMKIRVAKSMDHFYVLRVIYDSIPLNDEITRRFMNFICRCMPCNSTFISSVVKSLFTNMNESICTNVRLCAQNKVLVILDVGGLVR